MNIPNPNLLSTETNKLSVADWLSREAIKEEDQGEAETRFDSDMHFAIAELLQNLSLTARREGWIRTE